MKNRRKKKRVFWFKNREIDRALFCVANFFLGKANKQHLKGRIQDAILHCQTLSLFFFAIQWKRLALY